MDAKQPKATIFSIEEFSTFDGPGIRTTVFFKGCPLRCEWCHNPEGQLFEPEPVRNLNACLHCGLCGSGLREENIPRCPANALRLCGIRYTPDQLINKLLKNAFILQNNGGGVTFSGGEPLSQPEFLQACLIKLKGKLNRALQTCGYAPSSIFTEILSEVDYVLYDLKLYDEQAHIRHTGVSNHFILHNFTLLCQSKIPYRVRIPLIPGITDTVENIESIAILMNKNGVNYAELLPYHSMAGGKYAMVGRTFNPSFNQMAPTQLHKNIFERYGIQTVAL